MLDAHHRRPSSWSAVHRPLRLGGLLDGLPTGVRGRTVQLRNHRLWVLRFQLPNSLNWYSSKNVEKGKARLETRRAIWATGKRLRWVSSRIRRTRSWLRVSTSTAATGAIRTSRRSSSGAATISNWIMPMLTPPFTVISPRITTARPNCKRRLSPKTVSWRQEGFFWWSFYDPFRLVHGEWSIRRL